MYHDGELEQDILDAFERHAREHAVIVASSMAVPARNDPGDNPPHAKAKARYLQIVDDAGHFICTGEWPDADQPKPVVFGLGADGLTLLDAPALDDGERALTSAAKAARESAAPDGAAAGVLIMLAAAAAARPGQMAEKPARGAGAGPRARPGPGPARGDRGTGP